MSEENKAGEDGKKQAEPVQDRITISKAEKVQEEKKKERGKKQISSLKWAILVIILTFFISLSFSVISQTLSNTNVIVAIIILVVFIFINIVFDIISVAVTACPLEPFLAMASRKIYGAKLAVKIINNAEKFANICGDVVGDVCGIISGALGALIVLKLNDNGVTLDHTILSVLFASSIAALTVGGKSIGKKLAMDNSQKIIFFIARLLSVFSFKKK